MCSPRKREAPKRRMKTPRDCKADLIVADPDKWLLRKFYLVTF